MGANKNIVIVSGLPRSGTSLMMKMLEASGLSLLIDEIREADEDNPKGYYEYELVKEMKEGDVEWVAKGVGKVIKVVAPLLQYLPEDYDYKILFMRREMSEILASQKQMLVRRGKDPDAVPDAVISDVFQKQLNDVLEWIEERENITAMQIPYSKLVTEPGPIVEGIPDFLGLDMKVDEMAAVVDPSLYRQRAK